jgi:hypothetical protein
MKYTFFVFILLLACAKPKSPDDAVAKLPPKEDLSQFKPRAQAILERFKAYNIEAGYVVTRKPDGGIEHKGDAVLWTGLAMMALPCADGDELFRRVVEDTTRRGGLIGRWAADPKPEAPSSRDQVRGAMMGFTERAVRCGDMELARETWRLHMQYVAANDGGLFPGANQGYRVTEFFLWPWTMVGEFFGIQPHQGSKTVFESGLSATAFAIVTQEAPAYPIHLATLDVILSVKIGSPVSELGLKAFCRAASGAGLGLTDWLCRRKTARTLLAAWNEDVYEYQWQRATWETPDADGNRTPGVDFLLLYHLAGGEY